MNTGSSIRGALSYNEQKVRSGKAELVLASGFSADIQELSFSEKLNRFQQLIDRNDKVKTNTVHISLNFSPGEVISTSTMRRIAVDYMQRIGFEGQPFLVYQHSDSSHPHIHLVTTPIKINGKSIYLHNIAKRLSEPARKEIEIEYGIVRAEDHKIQIRQPVEAAQLKAAVYTKAETKQVISNIVLKVISIYKFASLEQFNAILKTFNVSADPGSKFSNMRQNEGLIYHMLDADGFKAGLPIKASEIYSEPTIKVLKLKFEKDKVRRVSALPYTLAKVNGALQRAANPTEFVQILKQKRIEVDVTFKRTEIAEVLFIDQTSRTVFSNDELGIGILAIIGKLKILNEQSSQNVKKVELVKNKKSLRARPANPFQLLAKGPPGEFFSEIIKTLLANNPEQGSLPQSPKKKKRKKKKY